MAATVSSIFPLTAIQRKHWKLVAHHPDNLRRVLVVMCDVPPQCTRSEVREAFDRIVTRHEALRCRVVTLDDGTVAQEVLNARALVHQANYEEIRLDTHIGRDGFPSWLRRHLSRAMRLDMGAVRGCFVVADDQRFLAVAVHHMYCDEYSRRMLVAELTNILNGRAQPTATAPQLSDFLSPDRLEAERVNLTYWKSLMERHVAASGLPPGLQDNQYDSQFGASVQCAPSLCSSLAVCARRLRISVPMLLQATLTHVLRTYWGQAPLLMQAVVLNRSTAMEGRVVACLANEIVIPVPQAIRFDDFVQQMSRSIISSMSRASYHYPALLAWRRQQRESHQRREFAVAGACNVIGRFRSDLESALSDDVPYVVTPAKSPIHILDRMILQAASIESNIVVGRNFVKVEVGGSAAVISAGDVRDIAAAVGEELLMRARQLSTGV
ncbi:condensation domain-containing protein [Kribbella speibonae]|uniref:Condensation domain-containing protein n=1 Tax=Kribbella speibonae TaxID=1572660 RepID=A0A4R0IR77_9ACTN|nr:condensation domain-containing protein [Kribbella speibonae]TCC36281.1 hypothetical protein E0H92_26880 [Kribbella speibonae]